MKLRRFLEAAGGSAIAIGADLTDPDSLSAMFQEINEKLGGLDILVMNASGGMEADLGADYAMRLNRDAQVELLRAALPLLHEGSRIVFVTQPPGALSI